MGTESKDQSPATFFKTLAEIGGYVGTLLPFLLSVLGKGSLSHPTLVSVLTLAVSVLVLWAWRWPAITRPRTKKPGHPRPQDTVRSGTERQFDMPLSRRRLEVTVLSLFALGTAGVAGVNFVPIREEITGFHCLTEPRPFRLVISDFSENPAFENDLAGILYQQSADRFQICRYRKQVDLPDAAQEAGERNNANLVVWGIPHTDRVSIYLTAIDWQTLSQRRGGLSIGTNPEEAAFLAELISAEILYNQGDVILAQTSLYDALDSAQIQDWAQSNPALFIEGHFELGLLFDPYYVPKEAAQTIRAVEEYTNAIDVIRAHALDNEGPYLNRAQLYYDQGKPDQALEDYSALLELGGRMVNSVHFLRSQIFIELGRCSDAIAELEQARQGNDIEADPAFPYIIFNLGYAYLSCGELEPAEAAMQALPVLSREDSETFLTQLDALAGTLQDPEAKGVFERIKEHIRKLHSE